MHRNQQHSRDLISLTVKPGTETGLYYILVANLAHRTTWRELKEFASQVCEVDHAEVYKPTSGWVRVKGRANFERALEFLNGNTLEYRALAADGRNLNQATVVKLPPTDYHAARIIRGDEGRVCPEPGTPTPDPGPPAEPFPQGTGAAFASPHLDYPGSPSPGFNMAPQTEPEWVYVTSPTYASDGGYQPAIPAGSSAVAYQALAAPNHGFIPQVATSAHHAMPQTAVYQTVTSPASVSAQAPPAQYQYGDPAAYYSPPAGYDLGSGQGYNGYFPPSGTGTTNHAYTAGYANSWPAQPPQQPNQNQTTPTYTNPNPNTNPHSPPPIPLDHRKILIKLPRPHNNTTNTNNTNNNNTTTNQQNPPPLTTSSILTLLAHHAGITSSPTGGQGQGQGHGQGQVERIELPTHRDSRPRGTAYVTFRDAGVAAAVVGALDGREVGGVRVAARVVVEGVERNMNGIGGGGYGGGSGGGSGGSGGRSGRRGGGGGGGGRSSGAGMGRASGQAQAQAQAAAGGMLQEGGAAGSGSGSGPGSGVSSSSTGSGSRKEEPPVIVDGSGRKKELPPVVVDGSGNGNGSGSGSGSAGKKGRGSRR